MQRSLPIAACCLCGLVVATPALGQTTDWRVKKTGTGVVYTLKDDDTSLSVTCVGSRYGGGATIDVVLEGVDPAPFTTTEILMGGEVQEVRHGAAGVGVTDCPECAEKFRSLWAALRQPGLEELEVVRGETSSWLDARGGDVTLGKCATDFDR